MADRGQRLTIVQYAGDFREASERLATGGTETYRGQRYTVDFVEGLAKHVESVTTITGFTKEPYDVTLPSGAHAIGAGFTGDFDGKAIARLVERTAPDRLILRTPSRPLLRWARQNRCRTLLLLADSSNSSSLKSRAGRMLLRRHLRDPIFEIIANHGVGAARNLLAMGVDAARVIAWDYPAFDTPAERPAKSEPSSPFKILFVGMLIADKGVDDLVDAVALLQSQGFEVRLELIGKGDDHRVAELIANSGVSSITHLAGVVPNDEIICRMAAADAVVVPSRHRYSEGMPLTIYEAYCARTPLIVSDHPMFRDNVVEGRSGLVFPACDTAALSAQLARLIGDTALYGALSRGGLDAWQKLQLSVTWGELIERWLDDSSESRKWLSGHGIAATSS